MSREKVLVTGGAGYIGSHVTRALASAGYEPVVYDHLGEGHREAVAGYRLIEANLEDQRSLVAALGESGVRAVVHMAAYAYVGESMSQPAKYYRNNVLGTLNLLDAMRTTGQSCLVASSSCTTYGNPRYLPIDERHPQQPVSPYGRTKLALEQMVIDYAHAYGSRHILFRYFNAAGGSPSLGEDHRPETHLIPRVLQVALGQAAAVTIYGGDYPTPDGTCVRDYVHVEDLASAHVSAVERLLSGGPSAAYNLGNERGFSVREVVECARQVTGQAIPVQIGPRQEGDPPVLVASSERARRDLNWRPAAPDLETIIGSAWAWHRAHPDGYATQTAVRSQPTARSLRVAS